MKNNIIIANFKMNHSFDDVESWLETFNNHISSTKDLPQIVVCPQVILLDYMDELLLNSELEVLEKNGNKVDELDFSKIEELTAKIRKINLGAQDCHYQENGAFTGDISPKTLVDAGCKFVILGHSERRKNHHETDEIISLKCQAAIDFKLVPIVCIGESLECRESSQFLPFIKNQILNSIPKSEINELIVAYEPVWSIGTGKVPSLEQISQVAEFISDQIAGNKDFKINNLRIVYGGSTNSKNTTQIMSINKIDGLLVGGASLDAKEFVSMVESIKNSNSNGNRS